LASADEAFFEYQFSRDTTDDPFNLLSGITNLPSYGVRDALSMHTFRLHNTHVLSPMLIHQARLSVGYLTQPRTILRSDTGALPAILMTGYSNIGHATNLPQERRNRSFEVLNDISWHHSSSDTKFGGLIRKFTFYASLDLYVRGQLWAASRNRMATVREYRGPRRIWHLLRHAGGWRQPFSIGTEPAIRPVRGQEQWPGVAAVRSCDCFPGQPARGSAEYLLNIAPIAESLFTAVEYITGISNPANFLNEPFLLRPKGYPVSPPAESQSAYPRLGRVAG